jgi:hypothetical protein
MSKLDRNIDLARRCIGHVNGLNIKSVNVPFRVGTAWWSSRYHSFVLDVARCETFRAPPLVLQRRRLVLEILATGIKTKKQKRAAVKDLMAQWGYDYFDKYTPGGFFGRVSNREDESRIRHCRRAVKTGHGNCGEKSSLCATWLLENSSGNEVILWVNGGTAYDHAWVVFDHPDPHWNGVIDQLSSDAVVVDGWTGDYYQARHPTRYWHGGAANPFQITVRHNILNASGSIGVSEHVRWRDWTESFSPWFRLADAHRPPSEYEPQGSHLLRTAPRHFLTLNRDHHQWDEAKAIEDALNHVHNGLDDYELPDD